MTTHHETLAAERASALTLFGPVLRGVLWGLIGYLLGALATALLLGAPLSAEPAVAIGYTLALVGWLLGIGAWEAIVLPWFGHPDTWPQGHGITRYWRFNTDHKVIGLQYLLTAGGTFLVAGLLAMAMRFELATPALNFFASSQLFNEVMSIHGTLMLFAVAVVAIVGGFGNYFVPIMVGAEDMVFPKMNGISYWFVPAGVLAILASPFLGGFQTGWTGYQPLASTDAPGQLLYFLGVYTLGISSLLTAINVIATAVYLRAPGLTWGRLPMFVWAMLFTSILNLLWVPVVGTGMLMGVLDRVASTQFFGAQGYPVLWQDLFWIFGHPEVYIIMLPAWGLWLEIIPVMARKTLFGYRWALAGFIGITFLSSYVWTHHMFTTTSNERLIPFMTTTELISIPTGFMYIAALGTLWRGRIHLNTPMLFIFFSIFNFLIGGLTGVFLADVPVDFQLHNTYFVVAHFHYTILGGMVFAWLAGMYYWFPKFSGRMYNETWGKVNAWWTFLAFNLTFFQMFLVGMNGMNRRVATYLPYLGEQNFLISVSAFLLGLSFLVPVVNFAYSWVKGAVADANPWAGQTLEWQTSSPPPHENFHERPLVTSDFYGYGDAEPEEELFRVPAPGPTLGTTGD